MGAATTCSTRRTHRPGSLRTASPRTRTGFKFPYPRLRRIFWAQTPCSTSYQINLPSGGLCLRPGSSLCLPKYALPPLPLSPPPTRLPPPRLRLLLPIQRAIRRRRAPSLLSRPGRRPRRAARPQPSTTPRASSDAQAKALLADAGEDTPRASPRTGRRTSGGSYPQATPGPKRLPSLQRHRVHPLTDPRPPAPQNPACCRHCRPLPSLSARQLRLAGQALSRRSLQPDEQSADGA